MKYLRILAAIVAGLIVGSTVNMAIIMLGPIVIPPPAGVDVSDPESIAQSIHLYEAKHFVVPFLAHAFGTLVGALVAGLIEQRLRTRVAYVVAGMFLAGGIAASMMIPAPVWFIAMDLILAYLPMAAIALWLLGKRRGGKGHPQ